MSSQAQSLLARFSEIDSEADLPPHQYRNFGYRDLEDIINGIPDGALPPLSLFDGNTAIDGSEEIVVLARGSY